MENFDKLYNQGMEAHNPSEDTLAALDETENAIRDQSRSETLVEIRPTPVDRPLNTAEKTIKVMKKIEAFEERNRNKEREIATKVKVDLNSL